jgi:lipid A 3-O-deacylase
LRKLLVPCLIVVFCSSPAVFAQAGPEEGGHEWQVWTGGGHAVNGSQKDDGIFNIGGRFGLILTAPHGPGFLRGRLEYAIDAVPVFLVTQRSGTAYGAGFNPFAFKWALDTQRSVVPYFEIGGGTLFTNVKVPENTSHVNFTTGGALGLHFLRGRKAFSAEVRFMHISNAGIANPNPGINTLQFRLGFGMFTHNR